MKLLIILGSGGHTAQMILLIKKLDQSFELSYLLNDSDTVTPKKITSTYCVLPVSRPFNSNIFVILTNFSKSFFKSFKILKGKDAVISAGPGLTIPVFIAAKIMGKKTIFIETWCRAHSKSFAGRICYLISDKFFIQWPEMKKLYPKGVYVGRLS